MIKVCHKFMMYISFFFFNVFLQIQIVINELLLLRIKLLSKYSFYLFVTFCPKLCFMLVSLPNLTVFISKGNYCIKYYVCRWHWASHAKSRPKNDSCWVKASWMWTIVYFEIYQASRKVTAVKRQNSMAT